MQVVDLSGLTLDEVKSLIGRRLGWYPSVRLAVTAKEGTWEAKNPRIIFRSSHLSLDVLRKLPNYAFLIDGVNYVLDNMESETYTETDYGYDGLVDSTYARIKITFVPKK